MLRRLTDCTVTSIHLLTLSNAANFLPFASWSGSRGLINIEILVEYSGLSVIEIAIETKVLTHTLALSQRIDLNLLCSISPKTLGLQSFSKVLCILDQSTLLMLNFGKLGTMVTVLGVEFAAFYFVLGFPLGAGLVELGNLLQGTLEPGLGGLSLAVREINKMGSLCYFILLLVQLEENVGN
jgi:hypothetical protein